MAHVTGGGLAANLARVLPDELTATLERGTWTPAPVFDLVRRLGDVPQPDLEATLNCGVGMVALLEPDAVDAAISLLDELRDPRLGGRRGGGRFRPRRHRRAGRPAPRLVTTVAREGHFIRFYEDFRARVCGNSQPAGSVDATRTH